MNDQSNSDSLVSDSKDSFFDGLDKNVNGMINDGTDTADNSVTSNPAVENQGSQGQPSDVSIELERMKKRYSDSSREAQKMASQLNQLKPFVPVLDAIKNDKGLVNHIKGYYENGKKVDLKAGLPEDFEFDIDSAINDTASDSRKVLDKLIQQQVDVKAQQIVGNEVAKVREVEKGARIRLEANEFMKRKNITEDDFRIFLEDSKTHYVQGDSLDVLYDKVHGAHKNVAQQTKEDMLNQMKNVRDIPVSQSSSNNAGETKSPDGQLFDALLETDGSLDNMFNSD